MIDRQAGVGSKRFWGESIFVPRSPEEGGGGGGRVLDDLCVGRGDEDELPGRSRREGLGAGGRGGRRGCPSGSTGRGWGRKRCGGHGGIGRGGGWYLKFVSLFICNHHHASHVCQKSQEGWGERRVCLCVSLFHSRFCWLEVGLVFGLSELCGGVPSSGSCPSLLYECRERAWKGGDENQKQKEKSCGFRGCSACSCPL